MLLTYLKWNIKTTNHVHTHIGNKHTDAESRFGLVQPHLSVDTGPLPQQKLQQSVQMFSASFVARDIQLRIDPKAKTELNAGISTSNHPRTFQDKANWWC